MLPVTGKKVFSVFLLVVAVVSVYVLLAPGSVVAQPVDQYSDYYKEKQSSAYQERLSQVSESERSVVEAIDARRRDAIETFQVDAKILEIDYDKANGADNLLMITSMSLQEESFYEYTQGLSRNAGLEGMMLLEAINERSSLASESTISNFQATVGVYQDKSKEVIGDYENSILARNIAYGDYSDTQIRQGIDELQNLAVEAVSANASGINLSLNATGKVGLLIEEAMGHLGKPYVWGGYAASDPPNNFDCSGFTSWCFGQVGVDVSTGSYEQRGVGTQIPQGEEIPGDLLVFREGGHVGIYLGDRVFIHASGGPSGNGAMEVITSNLDSYASTYEVRRLL